ncbi:DUF362 domain-containing protein [Thermococcus sp.]
MVEKVKIVMDEDRCYLCGGCAGMCPTLAINVGPKWEFFLDRCISCKICVTACPVGALKAVPLEGES